MSFRFSDALRSLMVFPQLALACRQPGPINSVCIYGQTSRSLEPDGEEAETHRPSAQNGTAVSGGSRLPLSLTLCPVTRGAGAVWCRNPGGPGNLDGPDLAPTAAQGAAFWGSLFKGHALAL